MTLKVRFQFSNAFFFPLFSVTNRFVRQIMFLNHIINLKFTNFLFRAIECFIVTNIFGLINTFHLVVHQCSEIFMIVFCFVSISICWCCLSIWSGKLHIKYTKLFFVNINIGFVNRTIELPPSNRNIYAPYDGLRLCKQNVEVKFVAFSRSCLRFRQVCSVTIFCFLFK